MVYLLTGPKGSGKTQQMIEQANKKSKECNTGSIAVCFLDQNYIAVAFL